MKADIGKIIKGLKSGSIDLDHANTIIDCADKIIELDKVALEYHKLRGEEPPDYLFSEKQIEDVELLIGNAKKEIQKRISK